MYVRERNSLTADECDAYRQSFAENGYFVIRDVVSPDQLAELHRSLVEAFDRARDAGALFSGGGLVSGHLNCYPGKGARFVYDTLEERGIIDLVRQLHPQTARMPNLGCNFNLPGSAAQHYHTDRPFTRDFIIANVAVVDTNLENGATEVIPGTHREFYKYTRFVLNRLPSRSVRVPLNRGDVLVRTSNVWHRGMPNRTSVPRPMLAFTWEDGGSVADDPFALEGGEIRFFPNWFRPTRLGRLRENLFVKLPITYSALRFARSLYDKEY